METSIKRVLSLISESKNHGMSYQEIRDAFGLPQNHRNDILLSTLKKLESVNLIQEESESEYSKFIITDEGIGWLKDKSEEGQYTDESIYQFLIKDAPIEDYCVIQSDNSIGGLIHFYDVEDGRFWVSLIEDNELNLICVDFLRRRGVPFFDSITKMNESKISRSIK
jgi:hypothetical protein